VKTNHQRGFKGKPPRRKSGAYFNKRGVLADVVIEARAPVDAPWGGKQAMAHAVRGAKTYANSRLRHHENAATRRLATEQNEAD
jgi:hypothetical protein